MIRHIKGLDRRLVLIICLAALMVPGAAMADPPVGLYALIRGNQPPDVRSLESPYVEGIVVRSNWKSLEPSEGRFRWDYFDSAAADASRHGRRVMMGVLPGVMTPEWVYREGARRFDFISPNSRAGGKTESIPLPWDEIFLSKWIAFVRGMGKRYNDDPSVTLVTMAGGAVHSVEMHLPKGPGVGREFRDAGYSAGRLVGSWKRIIDAYAEAFPDKSLALPIAVPVFRDGALEEIVEYAAGKLGERLYLATGALSERTKPDSYLMTLAGKFGGRAGVGFQLLSPVSFSMARDGRPPGRGGKERPVRRPRRYSSGPVKDLRRAFEIGLDAGASYFQVYEADIMNPDLAGDLEFAAGRMKKAPGGGP